MFLKLSIVLMGLSMVMAYRLKTSLKTDNKIHQLHSNSMILAENHKDLSSHCFPLYNPQLSSIVDQYERDYDGCMSVYESATALIDNCYKDRRREMETKVTSSCLSLRACEKSSTAYNMFECASATASDDAKIFYEISANATDAAAKSKSDYRRVDTARDTCVNEAERNYVEHTSDVYGQLNNCLLGRQPPSDPERTTQRVPSPPFDTSTLEPDYPRPSDS